MTNEIQISEQIPVLSLEFCASIVICAWLFVIKPYFFQLRF